MHPIIRDIINYIAVWNHFDEYLLYLWMRPILAFGLRVILSCWVMHVRKIDNEKICIRRICAKWF